jgi:hypothetical protein
MVFPPSNHFNYFASLVRLLRYGINVRRFSGAFWGNDSNANKVAVPMTVVILVSCTISALVCVPIGQAMGNPFVKLKHLGAYHFDLIGSLIGVICFGIFSALHTNSITWFLVIIFFGIALFYRKTMKSGLLGGILLISGIILITGANERWSAYYKVNWLAADEDRTVVTTNNIVHQVIADADSKMPYIDKTIARFKKPYDVLNNISPLIFCQSYG